MTIIDKLPIISLIVSTIATLFAAIAIVIMQRQNRKSNKYTASQETLQLSEQRIEVKNEEIKALNNRISSLENTRSDMDKLSKKELEIKDSEIEKLAEIFIEFKRDIVANLKTINDKSQIREEELKNVEIEAKKIAINESDSNEIDILVKKMERIQEVSEFKNPSTLQTLYRSYFNLGKYHLAAESKKRLIEMGYDTADNNFKIGLCYNHAGDIFNAVKYYEIATTKEKNHPIYWSYYGGALKKIGRYDEAIEKLNIAINLDNRCDDAYYNLGAIYSMKGDFDKSIFNIKKAIELKPETKDYIVKRPYFDNIKNNLEFIKLVSNS